MGPGAAMVLAPANPAVHGLCLGRYHGRRMSAIRITEEFRKLSLDDKLGLLHALWDEVAAEAEARPLSDAERRFLDERIRALESDVRPDRDWASVRDELLRRS